ncbi:acetyltransferase [Lachnospiraceae bacterium JC7]|nr:acetyltransferase [Lachnospiraceae bacterium JC7]
MCSVVIRSYKEDDYEDIALILNEGYESSITKTQLEKIYIGDEKNIIVAEENTIGKVVGCFFWKVKEDFVRPGRTLYMEYLVVSKEYRRQGIAHLLIDELESICKSMNCSSIEFTSANFRKGAHELYKSMGYTIKNTSIFIKEFG